MKFTSCNSYLLMVIWIMEIVNASRRWDFDRIVSGLSYENAKKETRQRKNRALRRPAFYPIRSSIARWEELFGNTNPVMLEIGCGRGALSPTRPNRYLDFNYIA
jgi:hypothetical protein